MTDKVKDSTDNAEKYTLLHEGLLDLLKRMCSIAFERAEVNDLITNDPDFKCFKFVNPENIFSVEVDPIHSAKIMSMISNLHDTVNGLVSKSDNNTESQNTVTRLEKVNTVFVL